VLGVGEADGVVLGVGKADGIVVGVDAGGAVSVFPVAPVGCVPVGEVEVVDVVEVWLVVGMLRVGLIDKPTNVVLSVLSQSEVVGASLPRVRLGPREDGMIVGK
jgi:hypothetical protein